VSSPVFPVLQAQEGTFYGTHTTYSKMLHFDQSGKTIWSGPNDYPAIATADGGVIGYSGTTYDNQGRATGQIALPILSWTGHDYQYGSTEQVASTLPDVATTFWPVSGANSSGNNTASQSIVETLYVRSFAPWQWFGIEPLPIPCSNNCFLGDDRSFTTSLNVTSRITGIIKFLPPSMAVYGTPKVYSDPSHDVYGRTATGQPIIGVTSAGGTLYMHFAGPNPLIFPQLLSPEIDTRLDLIGSVDAAPSG
jgi:hypothetical protein